MIRLLARLFIKDSTNYKDLRVRTAYGYLNGGVGIFLNILLFAGKFIAGTLSGSVAITADAFNNLSDAGSSVISLMGFKLSSMKPDPAHPFGHGRYEYISSLLISAIILVMGYELLTSSVDKILHPGTLDCSVITYVILGVSILIKLYMFLYNRRIGTLIDSMSMKATAADSISDAVSTGVVLISSIICDISGLNIDGYAGLAVAVFILFNGFKSAKETVEELLGVPPEESFIKEVEAIVMSDEKVEGIHDLIAHSYGPGRMYITLHAEVPANEDILDLHDRIDNLEFRLLKELNILATIHMDPIDTGEYTQNMKAFAAEVINRFDPSVRFHDFRIVTGPTHTNLIFDVMIPFKYAKTDEQVISELKHLIHEADPSCFAVIKVDRDYTGQM